MTMTSRERLMRAIRREKPDRLPATVHQWQPYHLRHFMEGMSDLEAFRATGLDAALAHTPLLEGHYHAFGFDAPQWRIHKRERTLEGGDLECAYTFTTPEGELTLVTRSNEITTWWTTPLVKREEDVDLIARYMPLPRLDHKTLARARDAMGDDGIMRTAIPGFQPGAWQDAVEMAGLEKLLLATLENPDWVHHFLGVLLERRLRFVEESLRGAPCDLIECGGGAASSSIISPQVFEEFVLPYDLPLHRAIHAAGFPLVYHTCGGMTAILDLIWRNECDAAETLTPREMGGDITDPRAAKRILGSHVALIGGVNQQHVLNLGDEAAIREHVRFLFETYGEGGGYICAPSDHFFDVPREKLELFARAAAECRYN